MQLLSNMVMGFFFFLNINWITKRKCMLTLAFFYFFWHSAWSWFLFGKMQFETPYETELPFWDILYPLKLFKQRTVFAQQDLKGIARKIEISKFISFYVELKPYVTKMKTCHSYWYQSFSFCPDWVSLSTEKFT